MIPSTWSWVGKGESPLSTWQRYYNVKAEDADKVFGDCVVAHRGHTAPFWTDGKIVIAEFSTPKQSVKFKGAKIISCFPATMNLEEISGLVVVESTFYQRGSFFIGLVSSVAQLDPICIEMPPIKDLKKQLAYYESFYPRSELNARLKEQVEIYNELDDARIELATAQNMVAEAKKRIKEITKLNGMNLIRSFGFDKKRPGELYILKSKDGNYIKIGIAQNSNQRHASLARSTPWAFTVLHVIPGSGEAVYAAEVKAHTLLEADNAKLNAKVFDGATEWFRATPAVLAYVDKIIADGLNA